MSGSHPTAGKVLPFRGRKPQETAEDAPGERCPHGVPLTHDCAACHGIGEDEPPAA